MLPILWLFGTSGVGKSATGYQLLAAFRDEGLKAAFVDADQLRLVAGIEASESDIIAAALPAVSSGYERAGAEVLVVAGLVESADELSDFAHEGEARSLYAVHLTAADEVVRKRIQQRGWLTHMEDDSIALAHRIDATGADLVVDTTGLDPQQTARTIVASYLGLSRGVQSKRTTSVARVNPSLLLTLTGPGGSGVSTIGFQLFLHYAHSGARVGYVDANQLGFVSMADDLSIPALRATNAQSLGSVLVREGVQTLIVTGDPHSIQLVNDSFTDGDIRSFWLDLDERSLAERLAQRSRGGGPPIPGDERIGLDASALAEAIATSVAQAAEVTLRPTGAAVIDTSGLDPATVAAEIAERASAPHGEHEPREPAA